MRGLRDRGKENGGFVVMADEWSESGSFCARTRLLLSLMLFRIFSEPLMSISNTVTKLSRKVLLYLCYIASKTFRVVRLGIAMIL